MSLFIRFIIHSTNAQGALARVQALRQRLVGVTRTVLALLRLRHGRGQSTGAPRGMSITQTGMRDSERNGAGETA